MWLLWAVIVGAFAREVQIPHARSCLKSNWLKWHPKRIEAGSFQHFDLFRFVISASQHIGSTLQPPVETLRDLGSKKVQKPTADSLTVFFHIILNRGASDFQTWPTSLWEAYLKVICWLLDWSRLSFWSGFSSQRMAIGQAEFQAQKNMSQQKSIWSWPM